MFLDWERDFDLRTISRRRDYARLPAKQGCTLAQPHQSERGRFARIAEHESNAVIMHTYVELRCSLINGNFNSRGARVLRDVIERFLNGAKYGTCL